MGQITRLIANPTSGSNTMSNTSLEPVLETILIELGMQDSIRSIREATLINSGRTLRFVYTNDEIKDVDLPQSVQAISIQKQGDTNIMTIRGNDGSIVVYTIESNLVNYSVVPKDDSVTVTRTGDERNVIFEVKANIPAINNGVLTLKQGSFILGTFSANQSGNTEIQIPITEGEEGQQGEKGEDGKDGKSAYDLWVEQGNIGSVEDFLASLKGDTGAKGDTGEKGDKGDKGDTGEKGDQGEQGIQGLQGEQGVRGEKGDKGDPFVITKTYSSVEEMQEDYPYMELNDYVMISSSVEDPDNAKMFVKTSTGWNFITDFSGAIGIKGEKGDTGEQGIQGIQGIQGEKGNKGDKGDTGEKGENGQDGQNGKSAYQIAIDNGFVGTEQQWLASLKGQDGADGINGSDGANGADGQDGITPHIDPSTKHWMIGSTDTGVIAEGKDGKDGESGTSADYEAYDMMVRNETEFLDAVARSHGWKNTFWNNDATHLITDTTSDPKTGVTDSTTKPCLVRIHLASNINSLQNRIIDLTHCEVFGHDFVLKITTKLHIVGRSAKFESVKFEHTSSTPDYYFYIEGQRNVTTFTHSKFRFTDCQFNNVDTIHPFITFIRGSVEGRNTYTVYIKGFETHDSTQNKFVIIEDTTSGQKDGNHNLVITNRYTTYNITVNMSSSTTMESRMLYDSSVTAGTVTGVTAKNIFSTT